MTIGNDSITDTYLKGDVTIANELEVDGHMAIGTSVSAAAGLYNNEKATRVSYRFSILLDKLNDLLKTYDEKRKELVQKHGEEEIKKVMK